MEPTNAAQPRGLSSHRASMLALSLGTLGVLYGDISTSPLYAIKECFHGLHAIPASEENIVAVGVPTVPPEERLQLEPMDHAFYRLIARFGFMETPNVPVIMRGAEGLGLKIIAEMASYCPGRETLLTTGKSRMGHWRKTLFASISRNTPTPITYFGLPPGRVVELGVQVEL